VRSTYIKCICISIVTLYIPMIFYDQISVVFIVVFKHIMQYNDD